MGGHNHTRLLGGEIATRTNTQLVQGGGEILSWSSNGNDGLHLGVMFGAGKSQSHSRVGSNGLEAQGGINGYSTGLYGTWHSNDSNRQGLYLDSSLSYSWFGNDVKLKQGSKANIAATAESYRTRGWVGSLESGYTWKIFAGEHADAYIQPQLQVTWMGVNANDRRDGQGGKVSMLGNNNVQTRLGSRMFLRGCATQDQGKDRNNLLAFGPGFCPASYTLRFSNRRCFINTSAQK